MNALEETIKTIKNNWFLLEPAYFLILCTHKLEFSTSIKCNITTGGGVIYMNPAKFIGKSNVYIEEILKSELIRIVLKHPYQRQLPNRVKMLLSSNFVIGNNLKFKEAKFNKTYEVFGTYELEKASLEEIYDFIKYDSNSSNSNNKSHGNSEKGELNSSSIKGFDDGCSSEDDALEKTKFWKEDEYMSVEMNSTITKISNSNSWGSISDNIKDIIKKSIEPMFDYKNVFRQFRSTVLTSSRTLTRMKPNRRFGYDAMGSKRDFTTRLLIAIDTSGSISNDDLSLCLGFIKKFFKYGISEIDTIMFDHDLKKDTLCNITKCPKEIKVVGRGGTDFNGVFKYVQEESSTHWDGVLIVTDGYASVPNRKWLKNNFKNTKYMWVLNSEENWKHFMSNENFLKFGKCSYLDKSKDR